MERGPADVLLRKAVVRRRSSIARVFHAQARMAFFLDIVERCRTSRLSLGQHHDKVASRFDFDQATPLRIEKANVQ
jgi:hypothetical protein